uniref:legumain n=1 Tax=Graphocephala atropunctata TaxID=36148 RepID=A0A1B6M9U3_9HEMI
MRSETVMLTAVVLGFCTTTAVLGLVNHLLPSGGQIKVVLVAGSNTYDNFRHQADVCHAYQILHNNGIPDENIIVMMYDDIANNTENPEPGVIINRPGGPNVYKNVPKDYTGKDVNKANFLNVLRGNKEVMKNIGTGRVLESGPNDHVFVNFVDHGGPGVLLMPEEEIMASELIDVLKSMSDKSRFAKMFMYIEACESGSIFDDLLPDNLNIFVMTAADPHESSYACFYDEKFQTYLGDVFSVEWMQDSETEDLRLESVNHQFQKVRTETNTSHVEEYGDIDIGITKMSEVIGYQRTPMERYSLQYNDAVPGHHVPVAILGQRIKQAKDSEEKTKLQRKLRDIMEGRKMVEQTFIKLLRSVIPSSENHQLFLQTNQRPDLTKKNVGCFEKILTQITKKCFSISQNPFAASHLHKIINLCNMVPELTLMEKVIHTCSGKPTLQGVV